MNEVEIEGERTLKTKVNPIYSFEFMYLCDFCPILIYDIHIRMLFGVLVSIVPNNLLSTVAQWKRVGESIKIKREQTKKEIKDKSKIKFELKSHTIIDPKEETRFTFVFWISSLSHLRSFFAGYALFGLKNDTPRTIEPQKSRD